MLPDGRLDFRGLLEQFAAFWAENAEVLIKSSVYHDPVEDGLAQLDAYLDRLRPDHGTLVIFDRRPAGPTLPPLPERISLSPAQDSGWAGGHAVPRLNARCCSASR